MPQKGAARLLVLALAALAFSVPAAPALAVGTYTVDMVETGSGQVGSTTPTSVSVEVTIAPAATEEVFMDVEITGPNDPDAGPTPETPDKACGPIAVGQTSCTFTYALSQPAGVNAPPAVDTLMAWVKTTSPDANEAANENITPGDTPEPDNTDVAVRVANPAVGVQNVLDCKNASVDPFPAPDSSLKPNTGDASKETYTCTVTASGNPVTNFTVDAENLTTVNDADGALSPPDFTCTAATPATSCTIVVPTEALTNGQEGTAYICFWIDDPANDGFDPTNAYDGGACPERWDVGQSGSGEDIPGTDVTKLTWEVPRPTTLDITGDGPDVSTDLGAAQQTALPVSLKDQFGNNIEGKNIDFKVLNGPNRSVTATSQFDCTTAADGTCSGTLVSGPDHFNGLDKICAWLDANTDNVYTAGGDIQDGGGCATEPASQEEDNGGLTDRGEVRWTGGTPAPTDLDMYLDTLGTETKNPHASTSQTITVLLKDEQQTVLGGEDINFEITGAGDPDGGDTPDTPDVTGGCVTASTGPNAGKCTISFTSNVVGVTTIRAWVDVDGDDLALADGDVDTTEGRNEAVERGALEEPDTTDVVAITWTQSTTTVTLTYSQSVIVYGGSVTLTGVLKAGTQTVPNASIDILRRPRGASAFTKITTVGTDANGAFRWTGRPGSSAEWRASFAGDPGRHASGSPVRYVGVRVAITIASNATNVSRGTTVTFTGKILPVHYQKRVYLQVAGPNNTWKSVATTLCDGNGSYRMTYRRNASGALLFRAFFPSNQDIDHGGNWTGGIGVRWN